MESIRSKWEGVLPVTARDIMGAAAETFHGLVGRTLILNAFDDVERHRHLPRVNEAYRKMLAAAAELAGELEACALKRQWGAAEDDEDLQVLEK